MVNFEELLKTAGFCQVSDNTIASKLVADCVDHYLENTTGITSFDVNRSILKLGDSGVNLGHLSYNNNGRNPVTYVCSTPTNVFIKTSSKFRYIHINDAIAFATGHNEDEVHVSLVSGNSKISRSAVYFRNEEGLREYLSPRIRPVRTAYHFNFSFEPLEKEK